MELPLHEGMIVSGCRVLSRIGEGGMGTVFHGHDVGLDRPVAIKIMHLTGDTDQARRRFLLEGAAIARVDHPGIVRIYSFNELEAWPYFIMEFIDGRPLKTFLSRVRAMYDGRNDPEELRAMGYVPDSTSNRPYFLADPPLSPLVDPAYPARVAGLMAELAEALGAAHAVGIIHRDLKPSNILLTSSGHPKLVDFGIVKQIGGADLTDTRSQGFLGTLRYASPEQLGGKEITPAADLFALGILLFEILTLRHPFGEEDADPRVIVSGILQGKSPDPRTFQPHIPSSLVRVVERCLNPDPRGRPTATELAADLRQANSASDSWTGGLTKFVFRMFGFGERDPGLAPVEPIPTAGNTSITPIPGVPERSGTLSPSAPGSPYPAMVEESLALAWRRLFHEFAVSEAIETLRETLALQPDCVPALYFLTIALNTIGEHPRMREHLAEFPTDSPGWTEADRRTLAILRLVFMHQDYVQAEREIRAYRRRFPDDARILWALAVTVGAQGQSAEVMAVGKEIMAAFPEDNLAPFLVSEAYEDAGRYPEAVEVLEETIRKFPGLGRIRLKIIGLLLFTGQFAEAERHLSEAFGPNPTEDLALILRARLQVSRRQYREAVRDLRQLLGVSKSQSIRAFASHFLYRIEDSTQSDPGGAAGRNHLEQAQAMLPEANFRPSTEVRRLIQNFDCSRLMAEADGRPWLPAAMAMARNVCAGVLDLDAFLHGNFGRTTCLIFHSDLTWSQEYLFCQYSLEPRELPMAVFRLPRPPQQPFLDSRGNLLRMEIRDLPAGNATPDAVMVNVHLAVPLRPGEAEFLLAELPPLPLAKNPDGRICFQPPPFPATSSRRQGLVLFVPVGMPEPRIDPPSFRRETVPEGTLFLDERFLFGGQSLAVEIVFDPIA